MTAPVSRQRAFVHEALASRVLPEPHVGLVVLVAATQSLVFFEALLANELFPSSLLSPTGSVGLLPAAAWRRSANGGGGGQLQLQEKALCHRQEHKFKHELEGAFCLGGKHTEHTFKEELEGTICLGGKRTERKFQQVLEGEFCLGGKQSTSSNGCWK